MTLSRCHNISSHDNYTMLLSSTGKTAPTPASPGFPFEAPVKVNNTGPMC